MAGEERSESPRNTGTEAPFQQVLLPQSPGKGARKKVCQCFQPSREECVMRMRCGHPLEMDPLPSLQETIHSRAATEYMPCTSDWVQERGLQGTKLLLLGGAVPRSTAGPVLPVTQKRGGKAEKLTPGPFSHRYHCRSRRKTRLSVRLQASLQILSAFSDSIRCTAVALRYNSHSSTINSKREK